MNFSNFLQKIGGARAPLAPPVPTALQRAGQRTILMPDSLHLLLRSGFLTCISRYQRIASHIQKMHMDEGFYQWETSWWPNRFQACIRPA